MNFLNKYNKKKMIGIIVIFIGLLLIVLGFVFKDDKEKETIEESKKVPIIKEKAKYQEFSQYNNFKLKQVKALDDYVLTYNAEIDITNKTAKLILKKDEITKYVYYDFNNLIVYISDDNKNWYKNTFTNTKLPDYTEIIDKVITISPYVMENDKIISLTTSARFSGNLYNNVATNVTFDKEGYIRKIQYDFSPLYNNQLSYTIEYLITDINKVGKVIIPSEITKSAKEQSISIVIDF